MSSLEKRASGILSNQEPVSTTGKALMFSGLGAGLTFVLATILPGGFFLWAVLLFVAGVFFA